MRVFAIADTHGNLSTCREVVRLAAEHRADAIVLAGDLLGSPPGFASVEEAQRHQAAALVEILAAARQPVLYIMGNDDLVGLPDGPAHVRPLHGRRVELEGWGFVGYQYSPPFMGGLYEKPEEGIAADVAALEPLLGPDAVFVTHCPADGILDASGTPDPTRDPWLRAGVRLVPGSAAVGEAVRRCGVRAHIHGHVHGAFGRSGCHFNVASSSRGLRALVVDLATLEHQVVLGAPAADPGSR